MMKQYAADEERPLTTSFIRELNGIILKQNFWKNAITPSGQPARMEVKVGEYKTRPNSVMTQAGTIFEYALPEVTPMLMNDLVAWYNHEYQKGKLSPIELATLLHYRYIRIHPFEDGNGRIARLLVNYVLLKYDYPMIVIQTSDRENYINTLNQCDIAAGRAPSDGARATIEHVRPFTDYMTEVLATTMENQINFIKSQTICKNAIPSAALQSMINKTQNLQDSEPQAVTNKNRLKL
jgi:Fic family protein